MCITMAVPDVRPARCCIGDDPGERAQTDRGASPLSAAGENRSGDDRRQPPGRFLASS